MENGAVLIQLLHQPRGKYPRTAVTEKSLCTARHLFEPGQGFRMPQHSGIRTVPGQQGPSGEEDVWALELTAQVTLGVFALPSKLSRHTTLHHLGNARVQALNPARDSWESAKHLSRAEREQPPGEAPSPHPTRCTSRSRHWVSPLHLRYCPSPAVSLQARAAERKVLHGGPDERM